MEFPVELFGSAESASTSGALESIWRRKHAFEMV